MSKLTTIFTILIIVSTAPAADSSITIATFDDPAADSTTPLFTIDFTAGTNGVINGGWMSTNLDLDVLSSTVYYDAKFRMTSLNLTTETDPFRGT